MRINGLESGGRRACLRRTSSCGRLPRLAAAAAILAWLPAGPAAAAPLIDAAARGDLAAVTELLAGGADVNATSFYGTALIRAAKAGHAEVVRFLLEKGADEELKDEFRGWTALVHAAENGHAAAVQPLLDRGGERYLKDAAGGRDATESSLKRTDESRARALWLAADNGRTEVVRLLLHHPTLASRPDAADHNGVAALHWASAKGHVEAVRLLLDKGARADIAAGEGYALVVLAGWTPLMAAADAGHEAVAALLIEKGASPDIAISVERGRKGDTALAMAAEKGHTGIVKLLLDNGADIDGAGWLGRRPLAAAIENKRLETARFLIERGASLDKESHFFVTTNDALGFAIAGEHAELVRLLVRKGADVNRRRADGSLPLAQAAMSGYAAIMRILLEAGADPDEAILFLETRRARFPDPESRFASAVRAVELMRAKTPAPASTPPVPSSPAAAGAPGKARPPKAVAGVKGWWWFYVPSDPEERLTLNPHTDVSGTFGLELRETGPWERHGYRSKNIGIIVGTFVKSDDGIILSPTHVSDPAGRKPLVDPKPVRCLYADARLECQALGGDGRTKAFHVDPEGGGRRRR